jgi:hypothetical protein
MLCYLSETEIGQQGVPVGIDNDVRLGVQSRQALEM